MKAKSVAQIAELILNIGEAQFILKNLKVLLGYFEIVYLHESQYHEIPHSFVTEISKNNKL